VLWCTAEEGREVRNAREKTLAAVRSGVVASLIEELVKLDGDLARSLPPGAYGVRLSAPGGLERRISFNGGTGGARLLFPRWTDMAATFSGGKGTLIPLPTGPGFLKAVKAFAACAKAVSAAMATVPPEGDREGLERKTRLLLTAALRGVCEVYNHDHWTAPRSEHIPRGRIGIGVTGRPDLSGVIAVGEGRMELERESSLEGVNALLEFRDPSVCYAVLTGAEPALGALGDGRVMTKGRLPMIQGLFPLLDRFGEIM